jgi:hypothetical protein
MTDATDRRSERSHGLERIAERYPGELDRAEAAAAAMVRRLGRDVAMPDEPAHVFVLAARGDREGGR